MSNASAIYNLELDRVRLRAIATRQRRDGDLSGLEQTRGALDSVHDQLAAAHAALETPPPAVRLSQLLGLSSQEIELLWAAVAVTMDPCIGAQVRDLVGGDVRHGISLALHTMLAGLDPGAARQLALALSPLHPLLRYGLLELVGDGVPGARPIAASHRVACYLAGDTAIDPVVERHGGVIRIEREPILGPAQVESIQQIARALGTGQPCVIVLHGPPNVGKRTSVGLAALVHRRPVVFLDAARMGTSILDLEQAFVALVRECLLTDALPLIANVDAVRDENNTWVGALARLLDQLPIPITITTSSEQDLNLRRQVVRVGLSVPDVATREVLWRRALETAAEQVDISLLAGRYRIGPGGIFRAVADARALATSLTTRSVIRGVRNGISDQLGELAQRVEVKQCWDDLVLSPDTLEQIAALVYRVRHGHRVYEEWGFGGKIARGRGTAGLFSGPPGTGKTMVAGLIARELELELYQVDLSKVVSKWVGETEKQLAKLFDAAEAGHALLLFDEADSLFAKRTEVKSSNDRYANLEVNYLLQRIEAFGGISILTTNLDTSIDPALRRRLAAQIVFYPPDLSERAGLWEQFLAKDAPKAPSFDFEALAHDFPDMTGANIRNAVIAAAFLAAADGGSITQQHLLRSGRNEYRSMGRVVR